MKTPIKRKTGVGSQLLSAVRQNVTLTIVVTGIVVLGIVFIVASRAATPTASSETETGTVAGNAAVVSDAAASGGKALRFGSSLNVDKYGAKGDGVTDDTAAIQSAFNAAKSGQVVVFSAGKVYAHNGILRVANAGIVLSGTATLLATNEQNEVLRIDADNVTIENLKITINTTTKRWVAYEQMGLLLYQHSGDVVSHVTIDGSGAAGLMASGASNYTIDSVTIQNTRADCLHQTGGSHNGHVISPTVQNCGDDGVAVVSYLGDGVECHDIVIDNPRFLGQTNGRGLSVVGGYNVTFNNIYVANSSAAALYFAAEPSYQTYGDSNVLVNGGTIINANQTASVDHGAILVYNGLAGQKLSGIDIENITISNTRASASRQIGIIAAGSGGADHIKFNNITITGGPTNLLYSDTAANIYTISNWTFNGTKQADHIGF